MQERKTWSVVRNFTGFQSSAEKFLKQCLCFGDLVLGVRKACGDMKIDDPLGFSGPSDLS